MLTRPTRGPGSRPADLARRMASDLVALVLSPLVLAPLILASGPAAAEEGHARLPIAQDHAAQAAADEQWFGWNDPAAQYVEPFRIFDHVYFVGMRYVSVYLIDTGDGLILIDALFDPHVERLVQNIRTLGFDPQDVRYVLITHGHFDHAGGARRLQELTGARIGMSGPDWDLVIDDPGDGRARFVPPARDLTLRDGDEIKLGRTVIHCLRTPGHTEGVASFTFDVHDGEATHTALVFGGVGQNFEGAERFEMYIDSVDRLLAMEEVAVSLPNHLGRNMLELGQGLTSREPGSPHPFVDAAGIQAWLHRLRAHAVDRLATDSTEAP